MQIAPVVNAGLEASAATMRAGKGNRIVTAMLRLGRDGERLVLNLAFGLFASMLGMAPAVAEDTAHTVAKPKAIAPNPLLTIDENRGTVVERVVAAWGDALESSGAGLTKSQLSVLLGALRADQLLAASLAGSLEGLRNVLANALSGNAAGVPKPMETKALGDAGDNLVYTPVTPCREVDTRNAGGPIAAFSSRDFKVWVGAGGFAAQGGSANNCGIPANPAAVVLNIAAVAPMGAGNFIVYPTGSPTTTSVVNYQAGQIAVANGAIVPACAPNCEDQITIATNGAGAHVVVDILGYFKAPGGAVSTAGIADGAVTQAKLSAVGGTSGQVLATDGTHLFWQSLPQFERWEGHVGPISGGNASLWIFAGMPATITIPPGPPRRLTASGTAGMALSSGAQLAEINVCYQNTGPGPGTIREFNVVSFTLVAFTTTLTNYSATDTVVLPSGTYNVGLCVNNNQGPTAIDASDYSHGWVMMTPL